MSAAATSPNLSAHRVTTRWRVALVLLVPLLVALMGWAIFEVVDRQLADEPAGQPLVAALVVLLCGGLALVFLAALIWAFRARVVIAGETMTVRGAFGTVTVTRDRMQGFRLHNGQLDLYLDGRTWAVTLAGLERFAFVYAWIAARTRDLVAEARGAEDAAISRDIGLGLSESAKSARLESLGRIVRRAEWLIYAAAAIAFANFLFVERRAVELAAVTALVLIPVGLDALALSHRGHVQVDYDEGSRYPQILTATLVAGGCLALMSLLDRGAVLGDRLYLLVAAAALGKGLLWLAISGDRLAIIRARGRLVLAITVVALFVMPAFWVGGAVYQLNKLLDVSPTRWHTTAIIDRNVRSGRGASYSVTLAAWDETLDGPVEVTLRRAELESFAAVTAVDVGVRDGAFGIPWVAELVAAASER